MEFRVSVSRRGGDKFELGVLKTSGDFDVLFPKQGHDAFINVRLPDQNQFHQVKLRPSFWKTCNHFGSTDISEWILRNKYNDYSEDKPPRFRIKKDSDNNFQILGLVGK